MADSGEAKVLKVNIVGCKGLRNADIDDASDPFVTLEIDGCLKTKTKVCKDSLAPTFNHEVSYDDWTPDQTLLFQVYDYDKGAKKHEFLGKVEVRDGQFFDDYDDLLVFPLEGSGNNTAVIQLKIASYEAGDVSLRQGSKLGGRRATRMSMLLGDNDEMAQMSALERLAEQKIAKANEDEAKTMERNGHFALEEGKTAEALELSLNALKWDPTMTKALRTCVQVHLQKGRYQEAKKCTRQLIDLETLHEMDWTDQAKAKFFLRDYDGCIEDTDKALEMNKLYLRARYWRARAKHFNDDFHGCIKDCTDNIYYDRMEPLYWSLRAMSKVQLGAVDPIFTGGAIEDCNEAIKLNYRCAEAWSTRGDARNDLGDCEGAVKDTAKALKINSKVARTWSNRADALEALQRFDEADDACTTALALDPLLSDAYGRRGEARFGMGNLNGAIQDCERAVELDILDKDAFCCLAKTKLVKGRYRGAMKDAKGCLAVDPDDEEAAAVIHVSTKSIRELKAWRIPSTIQARHDLKAKPSVVMR